MIPVGPIENGSTLASLLISIVSEISCCTYCNRMQDQDQKRLIKRIRHDRKCWERCIWIYGKRGRTEEINFSQIHLLRDKNGDVRRTLIFLDFLYLGIQICEHDNCEKRRKNSSLLHTQIVCVLKRSSDSNIFWILVDNFSIILVFIISYIAAITGRLLVLGPMAITRTLNL